MGFKQCGIYCYQNIVNGKKYIGQSTDLIRRHQDFWENKRYSGTAFQNAIKKYGKEKFQYTILTHCKPEELNFFERFYIARLKTNNKKYGYNSTSGGDSQYRRTEEANKHSMESWTSERKKKQSDLQTGKKNNFYGHSHDERVKRLVADNTKKYAEQRFFASHGFTPGDLKRMVIEYLISNPEAKYSKMAKNFKVTQKRISLICNSIGYTTDEVMSRMRDESKKPIVQCDRKNHDLILNIFPSLSSAQELTGINMSGISSCLSGKYTHSGGYFWRYANVDETSNDVLNAKFLTPTKDRRKLDDETKRRLKESGAWAKQNSYKKVYCYKDDGTLDKIYESIKSAEEDGFSGPEISHCCIGDRRQRTHKNRVFSFEELSVEMVIEKFVKHNRKPVVQMTLDGDFIRQWNSATEAAECLGLSTTSNINSCCHGLAKSAAGYKWCFS